MRIDDGEDIYYAFFHILRSMKRVVKGYLADHGTVGEIQFGRLRTISGMYWAHFTACNIFCCHQAFELGSIFFDIEAWGECWCFLSCEDRPSHDMTANGLLMDSHAADNLDATVPRDDDDDDVVDICLKGNVLEKISADRPSLYDVWAVMCITWFDVTTATCYDIGVIYVKHIAYSTSCHLDRIKRIYAYAIKMEHAFIRYRTSMPDVADCTAVDWGAKVKSSIEVCEHNTAWNAQALSSVIAASAMVIRASLPCTITLSRRLLRLSIQLHSLDVLLSGNTGDLDNGRLYQFPTSCCFGIRTTPRFCEDGSADSIKISSCTSSIINGERLLWGIGKIIDASLTRCTLATIENNLLLAIEVDLMHRLMEHLTQQLMEQRYNGYIQQLMDLAYYSVHIQHRRSSIMAPSYAKLRTLVRSYNVPSTSNVVTTNGELRFTMRNDIPLDRHDEDILSSASVTRYNAFDSRYCMGNSTIYIIWTGQIAPLHECHLATSHHYVHNCILPDTRAHILMYGFGLSSDDGLNNNHWDYCYRILGLILGMILLLQHVMENTLQTAGLFISISSRRGVTKERKFPVNTDLISICKYMGTF
jgi:hypothetical protein